jgi:thiosulfate/3-mercaptopyruvate sulfurtransferase
MQPSQTLITAPELMLRLASGSPVVLLDCGFDLADPQAGERAFEQGHLPQAQYAHLDRDLSGAKTGGNGRHPLPQRTALAQTMAHWGITPDVQVVAYDNQAMPYAARAWWLLRWMGHAPVAVLDGGRAAWQRAGGALVPGPAAAVAAAPPYPASSHPAQPSISAAELQAQLGQPQLLLLDARAAERFRGEVEPLDPVAGHIPGARQRFFKDNLAEDGCFKPAAVLRAEFAAVMSAQAGAAPEQLQVVHQCGSGVTACHNLLAMAHAGWDNTALYAGSWSEWCSDPLRPMFKGPVAATPS